MLNTLLKSKKGRYSEFYFMQDVYDMYPSVNNSRQGFELF